MASFTIYDPKTKAFRALETASESDLPFEQVLLINILIEMRVQTQLLNDDASVVDVDDLRAEVVEEIGTVA